MMVHMHNAGGCHDGAYVLPRVHNREIIYSWYYICTIVTTSSVVQHIIVMYIA